MTRYYILSNIKWEVDHDAYSPNYFILSGDFHGQRFTQGVVDSYWGLPLRYKKWCIERRFISLFKNTKI